MVASQCGIQWISVAMQGQENGKFRVHRLEAHIRKWHVRVQGVDALRRSCTMTTATSLNSIQALKQEHNRVSSAASDRESISLDRRSYLLGVLHRHGRE
jgi:hypothetical protein